MALGLDGPLSSSIRVQEKHLTFTATLKDLHHFLLQMKDLSSHGFRGFGSWSLAPELGPNILMAGAHEGSSSLWT